MSITIPNCIVEDCGYYYKINSCIYDMNTTMYKEVLNVDIINDFHNSYKYIIDFLLSNNFEICSTGNIGVNYNNPKLKIYVYISLRGYFIAGHFIGRPYKSYEFLEIMREMLDLNGVNKLAIKE